MIQASKHRGSERVEFLLHVCDCTLDDMMGRRVHSSSARTRLCRHELLNGVRKIWSPASRSYSRCCFPVCPATRQQVNWWCWWGRWRHIGCCFCQFRARREWVAGIRRHLSKQCEWCCITSDSARVLFACRHRSRKENSGPEVSIFAWIVCTVIGHTELVIDKSSRFWDRWHFWNLRRTGSERLKQMLNRHNHVTFLLATLISCNWMLMSNSWHVVESLLMHPDRVWQCSMTQSVTFLA